MKNWKNFLLEKEETKLEQEGYTLFFKKGKEYYAAKEDGRIIFAKIKTKDTKDVRGENKDIIFIAKNLSTGKNETFGIKDVKNIEICEKEEAELNLKTNIYNKGGTMCKCKCLPCIRGKCEKCRCKDCNCEGCSCKK